MVAEIVKKKHGGTVGTGIFDAAVQYKGGYAGRGVA